MIDIRGKLPAGMVDVYRDLDRHAAQEDVDYMVVGAMARDLVLHHGFGANIERGTRDVDFAVQVASWEEFERLKCALAGAGFTLDRNIAIRLHHPISGWELDIIPFGNITDGNEQLFWPPEDETFMTILGFSEALSESWQVQVANDLIINVASPAGVVLLKLIAWTEREVTTSRQKDARDIAYTVLHYSRVPETYEAIYDDGHMEDADYDEDLATALLIGCNLHQMLTDETRRYLQEHFCNGAGNRQQLATDMALLPSQVDGDQLVDNLLQEALP